MTAPTQRPPAATALPVRSDAASPETCLRVLEELILTSDDAGRVTSSIRGLAQRMNLGRSTVSRALATLVEAGQLQVERPGTGYGYPTRYRLAASVQS